jgi:hypothetical protein
MHIQNSISRNGRRTKRHKTYQQEHKTADAQNGRRHKRAHTKRQMAQNGRRHIFWDITVSNSKKYMDLEREEQKKSAKILYCTLRDLDSRPC